MKTIKQHPSLHLRSCGCDGRRVVLAAAAAAVNCFVHASTCELSSVVWPLVDLFARLSIGREASGIAYDTGCYVLASNSSGLITLCWYVEYVCLRLYMHSIHTGIYLFFFFSMR